MKVMKNYINLVVLFLLFSCTKQKEKTNKNWNDFPLLETNIEQLQEAYQSGSISIEEVTQLYLNRIEEIDHNGPELRSIIHVNTNAVAFSKTLDQERKEGKSRGPLHGIPIILKDNIDPCEYLIV